MAREIEGQGIATVCVMNVRKVAERILAPRTLLVDRPFGATLGAPGDMAGQRRLIFAALAMFEDPTVQAGAIREYRA